MGNSDVGDERYRVSEQEIHQNQNEYDRRRSDCLSESAAFAHLYVVPEGLTAGQQLGFDRQWDNLGFSAMKTGRLI